MPILYVGTQSDPDERTKIQVSDEDMQRVAALKGQRGVQIVVRDLNSGNDQYIKTASCGLGSCYCAVDFA